MPFPRFLTVGHRRLNQIALRGTGRRERHVVRTKDIVVLPLLSSMPAIEEGTLRG
jgi:hypothetical protein